MARHNVREQIVEAGLKTLLKKGFNACGVRDITEAAGVPTGSFYNHFASKEALGAEIVERYGRDNSRRRTCGTRRFPPWNGSGVISRGLNQMYADLEYGRGCLLGNFSAELADQSQLIRERLAALYASWTKDIEDAVRTPRRTARYRPGPIRPISPRFCSTPMRERCCAPGSKSPARRSTAS